MTEYELFDLIATWKGNITFAVIALIALLSTYLAVAHYAGSQLPRSQVTVLTLLMLWFSYLIITDLYTSLHSLIQVREAASFGYSALRRAIAFKWAATLGCAVTPILCIKFMFHVRHPGFH